MNLLGTQKQNSSVRSALLLTNAMQNKINILTINNNKLVSDRQNLINIINNLQQQLTKLNVPISTIEEEPSEKQSINLSRFQHIEEEPQVSVSTIEEEPEIAVSTIEEEPSEKQSINLSRFQHIEEEQEIAVSTIEMEPSEEHSINLSRFHHIEMEPSEEQSLNLSRFQHFNIL